MIFLLACTIRRPAFIKKHKKQNRNSEKSLTTDKHLLFFKRHQTEFLCNGDKGGFLNLGWSAIIWLERTLWNLYLKQFWPIGGFSCIARIDRFARINVNILGRFTAESRRKKSLRVSVGLRTLKAASEWSRRAY